MAESLPHKRVLICGSPEWEQAAAIHKRVAALPEGTVVITGKARGADWYARQAALDNALWIVDVPCLDVHWDHHPGKSAGHKRNAVMLDLNPDLVIAFQANGSSGTQGTIDEAERRGIPVEVIKG